MQAFQGLVCWRKTIVQAFGLKVLCGQNGRDLSGSAGSRSFARSPVCIFWSVARRKIWISGGVLPANSPAARSLADFLGSAIFEGSRDDESEDSVNFQIVNKVIRSAYFCRYALGIEAVFLAVEELRNYGRGCKCHPQAVELSGKLSSYAKRMKQLHESMGQRRPCPARGMVAGELATGKGLSIIKRAYKYYKPMLMQDLEGVTPVERNSITDDFDVASGVVLYAVELKLAGFVTVPFGLVAITSKDQIEARKVMRKLRTQYLTTLDKEEEHHCLTKMFFHPGSELSRETDRYIEGETNFKTMPHLAKERLRLQFAKVNEL